MLEGLLKAFAEIGDCESYSPCGQTFRGTIVPGVYDSGDCEDPTVAYVDGTCYVPDTGGNEHPTFDALEKRGSALPSTPVHGKSKEAEIVRADDGTRRLFCRVRRGRALQIGVANAPRVDGPWTM